MATCPECDAQIEIDHDDLAEMEAGDPWDCDACGTRLRVVTLDPLEFEMDEEEDEDEEEEDEQKAEDEEIEDLDEDDDADEDSEDWEE
jgi:hypothetical protein